MLSQSHDSSCYASRRTLTSPETHRSIGTFPTRDFSLGSLKLHAPEARDFMELIPVYIQTIWPVKSSQDKGLVLRSKKTRTWQAVGASISDNCVGAFVQQDIILWDLAFWGVHGVEPPIPHPTVATFNVKIYFNSVYELTLKTAGFHC